MDTPPNQMIRTDRLICPGAPVKRICGKKYPNIKGRKLDFDDGDFDKELIEQLIELKKINKKCHEKEKKAQDDLNNIFSNMKLSSSKKKETIRYRYCPYHRTRILINNRISPSLSRQLKEEELD